MTNDVTLPALGESVTEGTVTRWLKNVGDTVAADEPLLEISTDKVDTEIPSPFAGILVEILVQEDDTVEVGAVLARIGESGDTAAAAPVAVPAAVEPTPEPEPEPTPEPEPPAVPAPTPDPEPAPAQPAAAPAGDTQDVTLPALGESVTEGTVTRWLKKVGDTVAADEPLLEISTDKVDTEIPSPVAGTLAEIVANEDDTIAVGAVLARISGGSAPSTPAPAAKPTLSVAPEPEPEPTPAEQPAPAAEPEPAPAPAATPAPAAGPSTDVARSPAGTASGYVTPLVRKLASERGVDLGAVLGTGVGGRIRKEDVEAAVTAAPAAAGAPSAEPTKVAAPPVAAQQVAASDLRGTTVKMTRVRKVIADVMMDSLHSMAQLTTIIEVDMGRVWDLRSRAKNSFQEREGANLTFLPFFTKAVAEALASHASLNASIDGDSIVYHPAVNLGIAVDTDKGLMVPVIKDADSKSLADHAREIADLADRARNGGLKPDEMSGATFTVTNTGSGGTLMDTPIVAKPQVGILATCAIIKKPVAVKGPDGGDVIAIRPMVYLPLSYDHRLVDGADAARFLQGVRKRLEDGAFEQDLGL